MNDLQKKLLIVGITAFIVWVFMAISNEAFQYLFDGNFEYFAERAIYHHNPVFYANWLNALTFTTWIGSLVAFNVYKD